MKNLWNRATQRIYEAFNGPKVKDNEFDEKVNEMHNSEKGLVMLKELFLNCERNFAGMRFHCTGVYSSIKAIYDGKPEYDSTINEIVQVHKEMESLCSNYLKAMNDVRQMTDEWMNLFRDAKFAIEKREKDRREYEHYDEKMEEIMKDRAGKSNESPKDIEFYNRNEQKFKDASENYVNSCLIAYNKIEAISDKKLSLVNPSVAFVSYRWNFLLIFS